MNLLRLFWGIMDAPVFDQYIFHQPAEAKEPEDDSEETLAGHGAAVRFSTLGLLAPVHAVLLTLQLGSQKLGGSKWMGTPILDGKNSGKYH